MNAKFDLDHTKLTNDPLLAELADQLNLLSPIDSPESFNRYCREACRLWNEQFPNDIGEVERFSGLLEQLTIRTSWGGVVVTFHNHPRVEKYLVVRKGGYLALEMHEQKDEHLEVREGAGLILWRPPDRRMLRVQALRPNEKFHFSPGIEHCLIGTENLLVFERSTDPRGMDQDLIFIYQPYAC